MTMDEVRELILAGLNNDERVVTAQAQGPDCIGVEDVHGENHWIELETL